MKAVALAEKFAKFTEHWQPRIIAQVNDYHVKIVKVQGEFVWHSHPETDELFWVHKGSLTIELRDGVVRLGPGEMYVVPKGVEHRPVAEAECEVLMFEPAGTVNTGDAGGDRTHADPEWI
ncbi:MAG: cupin domain-containing protein [bacterium]|nr:cupin domain-containing protein [bacterium]